MLGLHRDSIVNLAALHHSFDEEDKQLDKDLQSNEYNEDNDPEAEEDFIGIKIDDIDDDDDIQDESNDKVKIYKELNNLAIISTAREKAIVRADSKESSKDSTSSGLDSDDDEYADYADYASGSVIWFDNKSKNNKPFECFFPCFPFLNPRKSHHEKDESEAIAAQLDDELYDELNSIPSNVSDDESKYGKPLTDLQHQAVLARLNLPEVRSASMPPHHALHHSLIHDKPDAGAGPINEEKPKKLKGILKRPTPTEPGLGKSSSLNAIPSQSASRRSLFPTSGGGTTQTYKSGAKKNIKFISLAKVCTIPSLSSMSFVTRSSIWWQKGEYDDFKKAARIITKALLTGGSEIWLSETKVKDKGKADDEDNKNTAGSKWWCKFGHSRRGLEHLCNITEGRNRQKNVIQATKAVVDEYRRQKVVGHFDDKRLANVSLQYTSWARDLAHAAALADQEGVKRDFPLNAKSRNDYILQTLLKHHHNTYDIPDCTITVGDIVGVTLPQQATANTSNGSTAKHDPHMLDAHTHSSMVYRKHQLKHSQDSFKQLHQYGSDSSLKKKAAGFGVNAQNDILPVLPKPKYGVV